jgi:hypothetical protein
VKYSEIVCMFTFAFSKKTSYFHQFGNILCVVLRFGRSTNWSAYIPKKSSMVVLETSDVVVSTPKTQEIVV